MSPSPGHRASALPSLLGALPALVRRLPVQPPSLVLALLLDRVLLPKLRPDARRALSGQRVDVEVTDLGLRVRLILGERGFSVAPSHAPSALQVRARSDALWRLARGQDDADRLFFERSLVVEGDTELGLVLKNTLDAIGPLWGQAS